MTAKTHTCITVNCDACGEKMQGDFIFHFDSIGDAQSAAGNEEWFIADDGRALCPGGWPGDDPARRAKHNELAQAWLPGLNESEREDLISVCPWLGDDYYADDDEAAKTEATAK